MMTKNKYIAIPSEISPSTKTKAIGLEHLHVVEVAWYRSDVIEITKQLKGTMVAILGGDVLVKRSDRFEHEYSNWTVERRTDESPEAYTERSQNETVAYVRRYPDPEDGSVAYVLVFQSMVGQQ